MVQRLLGEIGFINYFYTDRNRFAGADFDIGTGSIVVLRTAGFLKVHFFGPSIFVIANQVIRFPFFLFYAIGIYKSGILVYFILRDLRVVKA